MKTFNRFIILPFQHRLSKTKQTIAKTNKQKNDKHEQLISNKDLSIPGYITRLQTK